VIDREIEDQALQTIFFADGEFEGRKARKPRINYLALLNLHTADVPEAIRQARSIAVSEDRAELEADTLLLLRARNWRVHLMACSVMILGLRAPALLDALWSRLADGSWVAPQLAATAYLVDSGFAQHGTELLSAPNSAGKSVVAVGQLLREKCRIELTIDQEQLVASAQSKDLDHSGQIALGWLDSIQKHVTV